MRPKILLLKLAAIGDVALATQALADFDERFGIPAELHWIIDGKLMPLALNLLQRQGIPSDRLSVQWHPIDATRLFQGSFSEKLGQALQLSFISARIRPEYAVLLHRDRRYRAAIKPFIKKQTYTVNRDAQHELNAYSSAFERLAGDMKAPLRSVSSREKPRHRSPEKKEIGVLVGGGKNQKVDFREKRWPHLKELVELIASNPENKLVLFGGPEDLAQAELLLEGIELGAQVENLVGRLKLEELPEALSKLDALVSIDSGIAHIAAAVMDSPSQKIISLFGPTDPLIWAPRPRTEVKVVVLDKRKPCSPCYRGDGQFKPCPFEGSLFQNCMTDISASEVYGALDSDVS